MNNIEKLAIEQQPQIKPLWLVIDEHGYPIHCASYKEACNEHINDAINDFDLTDAKYWKVVEAVPKALQSSEPVVLPTFNEISKNIDDSRFVGHPKLSALDTNNVKTGARIMYDAVYVWLKKQNQQSTISLEEHNKRIAELEADIDTYVPIANQQATEIMQLQATNKTLLDALSEILNGWNKGVIDAEEALYKIEAEIKAIADAEGVDG